MAIKLKRAGKGGKVYGTFRKWTDVADYIEKKNLRGNLVGVSVPLKTVGGIARIKRTQLGVYVEGRGYV